MNLVGGGQVWSQPEVLSDNFAVLAYLIWLAYLKGNQFKRTCANYTRIFGLAITQIPHLTVAKSAT